MKKFNLIILIFFPLSFCVYQINTTEQKNPILTLQMYNSLKEYPQYQDIIIENKILKKGILDCQKRYEIIKPILDLYKRPITVLDLGAKQGYYSFRIANDYPESTCIMLEGSYTEKKLTSQLLELCKLNSNLNNIIFLDTKICQEDLSSLANCEHFDVVLAFDFVNYENKNWKKTINTILNLGDNIFIQALSPKDSIDSKNEKINIIDEYFSQKNGNLIFQIPYEFNSNLQNKIYWFECHKKGLLAKRFERKAKKSYLKLFQIDSTYDHKYLIKKGSKHPINWKKGINLVTFLMLNGAYPTRNHLKKEVLKSTDETLSDFAPWNIIVQGKTIRLIDQNDPGYIVDPERCIDFIYKVIDQKTQDDIKKSFKNLGSLQLRRHRWPIKNFFKTLFN